MKNLPSIQTMLTNLYLEGALKTNNNKSISIDNRSSFTFDIPRKINLDQNLPLDSSLQGLLVITEDNDVIKIEPLAENTERPFFSIRNSIYHNIENKTIKKLPEIVVIVKQIKPNIKLLFDILGLSEEDKEEFDLCLHIPFG